MAKDYQHQRKADVTFVPKQFSSLKLAQKTKANVLVKDNNYFSLTVTSPMQPIRCSVVGAAPLLML